MDFVETVPEEIRDLLKAGDKVLCCGDQKWSNVRRMREIFSSWPAVTLIHGAHSGADQMAQLLAREKKWSILAYPAQWEKGKSAGFQRDYRMLAQKPALLVVFQKKGYFGAHLQNLLQCAQKKSLPIYVVDESVWALLSAPEGSGEVFFEMRGPTSFPKSVRFSKEHS